jgi:hypothetical protein
MEKIPKRVDRPAFWMWTVPLVLGHVLLNVLIANGSAGPFGAADTVIVVYLARTLGWRFRDIGWPVWIGPTILLVTMIGLPFLLLGIAIMNNVGSQITEWFTLYGLIVGPLNLVLLIVAGSVPGKPEPVDVAHVFE